MKKKGLLLVMSAVLLLAGCGTKTETKKTETESADVNVETVNGDLETETEAAGAQIFTDDLDREVTITAHERVAALTGSFAEVWMLAGGNVTATVDDAWTSAGLDLAEDVVNLGSLSEPNIEQLIASKPDFVIATANLDANTQLEEQLNQAGIPVMYFEVDNFDDYLHMLDICTQITGQRENYEQNGTQIAEAIETIKKRNDGSKPSVLLLRAMSSAVKVKNSEGTVAGEILADLGSVNIADDDDHLLEDLSMEAIVVADPDYIFVTYMGDTDKADENLKAQLYDNPAWNSLKAVQNDHIVYLDKRLFNLKPNARWAEAYEIIADVLYPEEN